MNLQHNQPITRSGDLQVVAECISHNDCCAVVGISNIGKSNLLRRVHRPGLLAQLVSGFKEAEYGFVYIDFNLQLQLTGQGFYELVLRSIITQLKALAAEPDIIAEVEAAYRQVVAPTDEFQNALSFNQAIITLCERWSRRLVLLFDEFDEVFRELESRVFLNLRALRDKYPQRLTYVVGVGAPLLKLRSTPEIGEFAELFTHHTHVLHALEKEDMAQVVQQFSAENGIHFSEDDIAFIHEQSGGHPGLLESVCQVLAEHTVDGVSRDSRLVVARLAENPNVRTECNNLWRGLSPEKQTALLDFAVEKSIPPIVQKELLRNGILRANGDGQVVVFARLFEDYIKRQRLVKTPTERGVRVDVDAGQVFVDGRQTEVLTKLEYRLLLLLYGNLGKICDKYSIVEAVWGEDYIEEVDDARIEKLISRLRQKLEPDPSEPRYLITVRGRGYRLQRG